MAGSFSDYLEDEIHPKCIILFGSVSGIIIILTSLFWFIRKMNIGF